MGKHMKKIKCGSVQANRCDFVLLLSNFVMYLCTIPAFKQTLREFMNFINACDFPKVFAGSAFTAASL